VARVLSMPSVVYFGEDSSLIALRAASDGYPLRGRLKTAAEPFGPAQVAEGIPAPGEAWADSRLLARLGASVGSTLAVGAAKFKVTRVLDYRPDQGAGFADLSTTLLVNVADIPATELIQPGSRVSRAVLFAGDPDDVAQFREWLEARKKKGERLQAIADASPQIRASSDRAGRFLSLASVVSVLLSAIAVAMAARRYARRHLDNVALMKCMGASQGFVLRQTLLAAGFERVVVREADILECDLAAIAREAGGPLTVVGNLPYNISSQVVVRLIEARRDVTRAVLMFQRELAARLTALARVRADEEEIAANPRSRSAVMRVAERTEVHWPEATR